jgi:anti-sigma factor RsiW
MIKFKYRYCKVHMAQYLSGDLPDATRRRIARYIDSCEDCYNEYIQQRNLANTLERDLPALGRPSRQSLDNMWATIQTELAQPDAQSSMLKPRHTATVSYSLIMLMMAFMLMIPFAVGYHTSVASVDLPPHPKASNPIKTPTTVAQHTELATVTQSTVPIRMPLLHNTPAPIFRQ